MSEIRIKKKVKIGNSQTHRIIVISYPSIWDEEKLKIEVMKSVEDVKKIQILSDSNEFPDLEFSQKGKALSFVDL